MPTARGKMAAVPRRRLRVLVVEHSQADIELCLRELERAGWVVDAEAVQDLASFAEKIQNTVYDVILADYHLYGWTGLQALAELQRSAKEIPFIMVTGSIGEEAAADCIKQGATDYVLKDRMARLPVTIERALEARSRAQQQKQTAQQLWASEAKLGLLFAQLPAIVWATDADLRIQSIAGMGLPLMGWKAEAVLGRTLFDVYETEDRDAPPILAHRRALLGQSASYETTHGQREFSVRVEPLRDPQATTAGCLSLALDVTDIKQALRQVHETSQALHALIESAPVAILTLDADDRVRMWNPAAERMFGWGAAELIGQPYPAIPREKKQEHVALLDVVLQGGGFLNLETQRQRKDGSLVDTKISAAPLRDTSGKITGVIGVVDDITERKRAEAERLRLVIAIEQSAESIMIADPAGIIQYVNPAFTATTGYTHEEAIGQPTRLLKSGKHDEPYYRQLWQTIRGGQTWQGEITNRRKDGNLYTAEMTITPVRDTAGNITEFIAIQQDITERRALERQLFLAQKYEAIGQLAGGIAHDFNNVLGAVLGMAELGLMEAPAGSKVRERLEKIQHHTGRAVTLTRQLLAFARRQVLERRDINLNYAVAEVISLLTDALGKDIELKTKLAPDLAVTRADPGQIEQVLMNLCVNARDAMPQGGQLWIETKNVELDEQYCRRYSYARPGRYVLLTVSDSGVGMDPVTAEHIFEPFFTTKGPGKGTGLGLATAYGIVKQHGGLIHVYSEPGQGATFNIYLPISASPEVESPEARISAAVRGGNETILIAEDHEGLREFVGESLRSLGYKVWLAADGEEALRMFSEHRDEIDLIVLDVVMPKLRGPEVFSQICALRPSVPVIFCSGYSNETPLLSAPLKNGATILQKPYTTKSLVQAVRAKLDQARTC